MGCLNSEDSNIVLPPDHECAIQDIQALHGLILEAFARSDHVCLAVPEDAAVDLSFIQLIESARRHAGRQGRTIRLARPAGRNVRRVLERGGFLSRSAPDAFRFWLHEEAA